MGAGVAYYVCRICRRLLYVLMGVLSKGIEGLGACRASERRRGMGGGRIVARVLEEWDGRDCSSIGTLGGPPTYCLWF